MLVFMYSEARQNFATVLDRTSADGAVIIKRQDGSAFRIVPELPQTSPFDGVRVLEKKLPSGELADALADAKNRWK